MQAEEQKLKEEGEVNQKVLSKKAIAQNKGLEEQLTDSIRKISMVRGGVMCCESCFHFLPSSPLLPCLIPPQLREGIKLLEQEHHDNHTALDAMDAKDAKDQSKCRTRRDKLERDLQMMNSSLQHETAVSGDHM